MSSTLMTWLRDVLMDAGLDVLLRPGFLQILWWQWIAFPVVGLVSWAAGRLMRAVSRPILARLTARTVNVWDDQLVDSVGPPVTLAFAVMVFAFGCLLMELSGPGLAVVSSFLRAALAFAAFWALWRSTGVFIGWLMTRPWATTSPSARNLLTVSSNILRGVIFGVGLLAMIGAFGYPVGTVLAGLGIGGLALAFGAQKTVENVFGSVSLAVDQPFRVGDLVKVEDFMGTVEDIGLRSTRFRTPDRTLVSIPNGKLADQRLESFEARDRLRFAATVSVKYGTTRPQMETLLAGLEATLRAHPRIWPDAIEVKFSGFGPSSLDVEVSAWFQVSGGHEFLQCRQDVLLDFMRVVEESGTSFALPTRTVHLVPQAPG
ncbi:MAG: mechanosensitive ion channel family protein [Vicinamibacterales bacterium]